MELIIVKAISLATVLFISVVLSLLPLKFASVAKKTLNVERRRLYKRLMSFFSCFGGGVFLGASLLDLLPDARETFDTAKKELDIETEFPLVEFVISIGFFIVFIVEQIVLAYKENHVSRILHVRRPEREHLIRGQHESGAAYDSIDDGSFAAPSSVNDDGHDHSIMFSTHEDPSSHSTLRTVILLLALSLHSVFEGLAIGLQSIVQHLVQLLVAVLIHKGIIAFSLGLNLTHSRLKLRVKIFFVIGFACASPIGIALGMGINNLSHSTILINAILQGFACGTFLYVTFFEVIPHELNHKEDRLLKLIFIIVGFATVCGAIFLVLSQNAP